MRLNRSFTSGTILLEHYYRAFYTLLLLSCFFKDDPFTDALVFFDLHYEA